MDKLAKTTERIVNGELTAATVAKVAVDNAENLNDTLNAFLEINRSAAQKRAEEIDQLVVRIKAGSSPTVPALCGIPIAIKDNICVRGMQTSCGSRILGDYQAPYNATVIERLDSAGAVIIGKTNCDEFAMGSSNENSAFGTVKNPWDTTRVPGGSSGGSAAAVASGVVRVALGSDTGGSVRQPASFCGVLGLKPTYGRNSRYGLVAFASSLDQVGVFGASVDDVATVLGVIAGRDRRDSTTADVPVPDYRAALTVMKALVGFHHSLVRDSRKCVRQSSGVKPIELGAEIVPVELPRAQYAIAVYYIIATAELRHLARFDGVRYGFRAEESNNCAPCTGTRRGFGPEVKRRIMLGTMCYPPAITMLTIAKRNRYARC